MKTEHTAEWKVLKSAHPNGIERSWDFAITEVIDGKPRIVAESFEIVGEGIKTDAGARAKRIVDCVSACAGMPYPSTSISALRSSVEVLREALNELLQKRIGCGMPVTECWEKARTALNSTKP